MNVNTQIKRNNIIISRLRITRQRYPVLRRLRETPLGFCLRVIVNNFHPNLEKTTYIYIVWLAVKPSIADIYILAKSFIE